MITEKSQDHVENADLLARARTGDAEAFCLVAEYHEAQLLRQALALSGDQSVAEDITQETLIEAWKSIARFDGTCRFSTWLYAILLHRHLKWCRSVRRRPVIFSSLANAEETDTPAPEPTLPTGTNDPADDLLQKEFCEEWRAAIEGLPELHQQVILLRFYGDASLEDIARLQNCALGTVKSRLHYALDKLRSSKFCLNLSTTRRDT